MKLSNGLAMISGKPVLVLEQHPDVLWMWYDYSVTLKGGKKWFNIPRNGEMEGACLHLVSSVSQETMLFFSEGENEFLKLKEGERAVRSANHFLKTS